MLKVIGAALTLCSSVVNFVSGSRKTFFTRVKCEQDLKKFQELFFKKENIALPLEYLSRGKVFFCRNRESKIVGGFAIVLKGPFRSIEQIPGLVRAPKSVRLEEVNGVWRDTTSCFHGRMRFWTFFCGQLLRSPGNAIVYAVDAKKHALRKSVFNQIREWTLFEGQVDTLEGMSAETPSLEAVEVSFKARITSFLFRNLFSYCTETVKCWVKFRVGTEGRSPMKVENPLRIETPSTSK